MCCLPGIVLGSGDIVVNKFCLGGGAIDIIHIHTHTHTDMNIVLDGGK